VEVADALEVVALRVEEEPGLQGPAETEPARAKAANVPTKRILSKF
jgi:hypothetical protein